MRRSRSKSAHECIPYNKVCAKFYPDPLRFGSPRAKKPVLGLKKNRTAKHSSLGRQ